MSNQHEYTYTVDLEWTGNLEECTSRYRSYSRNHDISAPGKPSIPGSADPDFRGDPARYNPEELLTSALSACHMLWYLHLCSDAGIRVVGYHDRATGIMHTSGEGGRFAEVLLRPEVTIAPGGDPERAVRLHERAHAACFVASSVNFPVRCAPTVRVAE